MDTKAILDKTLIHTKQLAVRWGDLDAYGHVNNIFYFLYIQEARFEMMVENSITIDPLGISPVLAETYCKFIRPINFPETIIIETWLVNIDGKKVFFEHVIKSSTKNEVVYAILSATVIWFNFQTKSSAEVPTNIQHLIHKTINIIQ